MAWCGWRHPLSHTHLWQVIAAKTDSTQAPPQLLQIAAHPVLVGASSDLSASAPQRAEVASGLMGHVSAGGAVHVTGTSNELQVWLDIVLAGVGGNARCAMTSLPHRAAFTDVLCSQCWRLWLLHFVTPHVFFVLNLHSLSAFPSFCNPEIGSGRRDSAPVACRRLRSGKRSVDSAGVCRDGWRRRSGRRCRCC